MPEGIKIDVVKTIGAVTILSARHMETIAGDVADDARRAVPVRTGELRRSIYHRVMPAFGGTVTGRVGATARHARFVELGTRKMAAQPFLRPALYRRRSISRTGRLRRGGAVT